MLLHANKLFAIRLHMNLLSWTIKMKKGKSAQHFIALDIVHSAVSWRIVTSVIWTIYWKLKCMIYWFAVVQFMCLIQSVAQLIVVCSPEGSHAWKMRWRRWPIRMLVCPSVLRTTTAGKSECIPRSTENTWSANTPGCPQTRCMPREYRASSCKLGKRFSLSA